MGAWIDELGAAERLKFGSPVLTLEARLRAALAATRGDSDAPDSFRAAAVCECLCRLAEQSGSHASILQLLKAELLRCVYVGGGRLSRGATDGEALLAAPTFFAEAEALRRRNDELTDLMAAWKRAKAELQRDADGRAELLRVALGRWNSVLASLDGVRDASRNWPSSAGCSTR